MAQIKCLLWDFGDTLCDEKFIWSSAPEWMEIYASFDADGLGARWCLGEIDTNAFASALAQIMDRTAESIVTHMTKCCHAIDFFTETYAFFQTHHLPQAIVTVNPDLFSDIIVPAWTFQDHCEVIVTSWEERTDDKRILSRLAIERLGLDCDNDAALLIDNKRSNIDDWRSVGGAGYHYTNDQTFAEDSAVGIDGMARPRNHPAAAPNMT